MVIVDQNAPAVRLHGGPHDRQAQARSAAVTTPSAIEAAEAFKDALSLADWNAGAVVGHPQLGNGPPLLQRHDHTCGGMAERIVEEVADHATQPFGAAG